MEDMAAEAKQVLPEQRTCACHAERYKANPRDEVLRRQLQNRLNRMIGQLNGLKKMVDADRYCGDILIQISAVESALQNFGYIVLENHLATCVSEEIQQGNTDIIPETVDLIRKLK